MHFKINLNIADNDYIDYNTFVAYGPSYGRKNLQFVRLLMMVVYALFIFAVFLFRDHIRMPWLLVIMLVIAAILHQVFLKKVLRKVLKKK